MNVLFIAVDTLRADHLGCYGYGPATSPQIDQIAAAGLVVEEFIAPHIPTHPGFTTMFTGRDVFDHQIITQGGARELDERIKSLPEILRAHGYFTAAADNLGRWFERGYDVYERFSWDHDPTGAWRKAEAVNDAALKVLAQCDGQDKPWFAFIHYWDPHTPYLPPKPFDRMFYSGDEKDPSHTSALEMMTNYPAFQYYFEEWMPGCRDVEFPGAQYDAEIAYCDTCLSHVFTYLDTMKGAEDTLIVITSDHGEELDEHEMWFDHHGLYETNLHIPLILYHPDYFCSGETKPGLAIHQDLAPTILDVAGLETAIEENRMQGVSLLDLPEGVCSTAARESVYITECAWMKKHGFRTERYKFFESLYDELHKRPRFELYDLLADPGEQINIADQSPTLVEKFRTQLAEHVAKRLAEAGGPNPIEEQSITLTHVGNVDVAVPDDQILEGADEDAETEK